MPRPALARSVLVAIATLAALVGPRAAAAAPEAGLSLGPTYLLGAREEAPAASELGPLAKEAPLDPAHPLPRVIVDVEAARGALGQAAIQAAARRLYWAKAVACYRRHAWAEQGLRVDQRFDLDIRRGHTRPVAPAGKRAKREPAPTSDTGRAVASCLREAFEDFDLGLVDRPIARKGGKSIGTRARLRVRIAPGDEPIAPPDAARERGPGTIDTTKLDASLKALAPALDACFVTALDYAPALTGELRVRLRVEPSGRVSEAFEHGGAFADPRVARCALKALRGATLEPADGGFVRVVLSVGWRRSRA